MKSEPAYEYRFEDRSLLLRLLTRPVLEPLVAALPRRWTPNAITLCGHGTVWFGLVWLFTTPILHPALALFLALAHVLYVLSDCLDGMFARATQRSSRLGEMLDHWLDAITVPLVPIALGLALQQPPGLVLASTMVTTLLHFLTFDHGYRFGYVHLGAIGVIEITLGAALFYGLAAVFGLPPLTQPAIAGLSIPSWLILSSMLGGTWALVSLRKLCQWPGDFFTPLLLQALIALWFSFGHLSLPLTGILSVSAGAYHEGKVIAARLLHREFARWNLGFLALLGLMAGGSLNFAPKVQSGAAAIVILYAVIQGARDFLSTLRAIRPTVESPRRAVEAV